MDCPPGTLFDLSLKICNHAYAVKCSTSDSPPSPPAPTQTTEIYYPPLTTPKIPSTPTITTEPPFTGYPGIPQQKCSELTTHRCVEKSLCNNNNERRSYFNLNRKIMEAKAEFHIHLVDKNAG